MNRSTTSTVEDYLKCVLVHAQESPVDDSATGLVSMGQIASALDVAPGTVTAMMKTLSESGLVEYEPYSGVRLTPAGHKLAIHVLRRHRLIELFLVEVLDLDWSEVHAEAELLEHAVSDRLIERIDEMLGRPSVDPHGDPIPNAEGDVAWGENKSLLASPAGKPLEVVRVGDQSVGFLRLIEKGGLMPGEPVEIVERNDAADALTLAVGERAESFTLGFRAAAKIFVRAIEQ